MTAVTSATDHDNYAFFLPVVYWCWKQLGIDMLIVIPNRLKNTPKFRLIAEYTPGATYKTFTSPRDKEITYAQTARLFAAADPEEIYITTDADMVVFRDMFGLTEDDNYITILGADLVPEKQYPICYAFAYGSVWKDVMKMGDRTMQQCLDDDLGPIECEHFSGNYWSHDQDLLYKHAGYGDARVALINRAYEGTQFASKRIDRTDGMWETMLRYDTIDFHMWRPGYDPDNFTKILRVIRYFYPDEDMTWMLDYRTKYVSL